MCIAGNFFNSWNIIISSCFSVWFLNFLWLKSFVPIAGAGVVAAVVVVVEVVVLVVAAVDLVVVFGMKAEMAVVTEIFT